jgi:NTP pyrophosphatase (non-canonical NTP hydrolase)
MKKIKITKGNYWYENRIGEEFEVLSELGNMYEVLNEGDITFRVMKTDCESIEYTKVITSGTYVKEVLRTEPTDMKPIYERSVNKQVYRLLHAGLGMTTESGEFVDTLKKFIFYGKPLDLTNLKEELGDLMWYIGLACDTLGISLNEVLTSNIEKLKKRYPEKFTEEKALNRDIDNELKHM